MKKFGKLAALVVALYVVQTSVLPAIAYRGISADLMMLVTVSFAFLRGARQGSLMGFATGLLEDLSTGTFAGVNAFSHLLIGMAFGKFSDRLFKEQFFFPVIASLGAIAMKYFILALLMLLLGYRFNLMRSMQTMLVPMLIYQLAFAYPVHRLVYDLNQKLSEKEKH